MEVVLYEQETLKREIDTRTGSRGCCSVERERERERERDLYLFILSGGINVFKYLLPLVNIS